MRVRSILIAVAVACSLAACRVEVYDGLSQRDANEMTALLIDSGVSAKRVAQKDGAFAVTVAEDDFARAVQIISQSGLPKPQFASIVDVLNDDRLIASPNEERARLNYAVAQELSRTVSEIEGVVSARVHLATPADDPLSRRGGSLSSASVAIHHAQDFNTAGFVPRIKTLVANAVDGLDYDRVSIALFPTTTALPQHRRPEPADQESQDWADPLYSGTDGRSGAGSGPARAVTLAAIMDGQINPIVAAILGGALIVLLLAGHSIFSGSRRKSNDTGRASRRRDR